MSKGNVTAISEVAMSTAADVILLNADPLRRRVEMLVLGGGGPAWVNTVAMTGPNQGYQVGATQWQVFDYDNYPDMVTGTIHSWCGGTGGTMGILVSRIVQ